MSALTDWIDPRLPELGREFGTALLLAAAGIAVALDVPLGIEIGSGASWDAAH